MPNLSHDRNQRHPTDPIIYNGVHQISVMVSSILLDKKKHCMLHYIVWDFICYVFLKEPPA